MLRIAVCDDNRKTIEYVKNVVSNILKKQDEEAEIDTYLGGEKLQEAIQVEKQYDMLFLDLYMPDLSGLDLGNRMRTHSPETLIIIVSNRTDYVFETFKMKPFRFVRKQRFKEEIEDVVLEAVAEIHEQNEPFWVHSGTARHCLYIRKILWIESHDKQIDIVYAANRVTIRYKISDMVRSLAGQGFVQIHRSILVNVRHIQRMNRDEIWMDNGQNFTVAKNHLETVRMQMQSCIWEVDESTAEYSRQK